MSTITLTLEVPDDLAERLAAMESFDDLSPADRFLHQRREENQEREEKFRRNAEERRALKAGPTAEWAQESAA